MFEDRTKENILAECLANAPPDIDLRQGGIYFDAVASVCSGLEKYYVDLRHAFDVCMIMSPECADEYLDRKGWEYNITRNAATPARYKYVSDGDSTLYINRQFFTDGLYFRLKQDENQAVYLEAEIPGILCNNILPGTAAVPMENLNLAVSQFGSLVEPGADIESNESYRERIREKIAGTAENGNRQHYKTWCESIDGVGRARIIPLFAGENTVMGVIIGADGLPAAQTLLNRVQEYIDPMTLGATVEVDGKIIPVGDGLGDGIANIGAHFAAVPPETVPIDIYFLAEPEAGVSISQIKELAEEAAIQYFKNAALAKIAKPEKDKILIRLADINYILYSLPSLVDYTNLTINGGTSNIELTGKQIAVLGEVSVSAAI